VDWPTALLQHSCELDAAVWQLMAGFFQNHVQVRQRPSIETFHAIPCSKLEGIIAAALGN
jgi:hypothetical protein